MATGWEALGSALAGPPAQDSLRSARTEEALIRAAMARDKILAQRSLATADPTNLTPQQQMGMIAGGYGTDYSGVMRGRNLGQEFDFKNEIADPNTPMADRQYAAQAVSGKPVNFLDAMGQGAYADIRNPDAGVQQTPLGDAMIGAESALEEQRHAVAAKAERTKAAETLDSIATKDRVKRLQGVIYSVDPLVDDNTRAHARAELESILHPDDGSDDAGEDVPPETEQPTAAPSLWDRIVSSVSGSPAQAAPAAPAATAAPKAGDVEDGYRFMGGDPADPANWKAVR